MLAHDDVQERGNAVRIVANGDVAAQHPEFLATHGDKPAACRSKAVERLGIVRSLLLVSIGDIEPEMPCDGISQCILFLRQA